MLGIKLVFDFREAQCPPGYTGQSPSIQDDEDFRCIPPGGLRGLDLQSLPMGSRHRQVGLYLANVDVRVYHLDRGNYLWLARDVPAPP